MKYPVDREEFAEMWLKFHDDPDDTDKEFGLALADFVNKAYEAGLEDGKAGMMV